MEIEQVTGTLCGGNISLKYFWNNICLYFVLQDLQLWKWLKFKHHFDSETFLI